MAERENKALIERYFDEVRNAHQGNVVEQVFSSDVTVHVDTPHGEETIRGVPAIRQTVQEYATALPDLRFTIEDQIAEGEKVVVRWRAEGTHRGELQGVAATGKRVSFAGVDIFRVANGRIAEGWSSYDRLGILQQIGAMPTSGQGRA